MFGTPVETLAVQVLMVVCFALGVISGAQLMRRRKEWRED